MLVISPTAPVTSEATTVRETITRISFDFRLFMNKYLLVYAVTAVQLGVARCSCGSRTRVLCYNVTYFTESVNIHNIVYPNGEDK